MAEYDRMKAEKDEILQRQREALERPLLAEIDRLKLELRYALSTTMIQNLNQKIRNLESHNQQLVIACKGLISRFTGLFDSYVRKTYSEGSNPDADLEIALSDARAAIAKSRTNSE